MTTKMTTEEQAALARRVYETIYNGTESFHGIGTHIAYLVGGILTGASGIEFFEPLEEQEQEFVDMLHDLFEDDDVLWQYVTVNDSQDDTEPAESLFNGDFEDDCEIVDANTDF